MKDDRVYLKHILDEVSNVEDFLFGIEKDDFLKDKKTRNAVVRSLEVIGEVVNNLSGEIKEKSPELPWQDIKDMRNKLIHEYFGVDMELVWLVAKKDVPKLKEVVQKLLE